MNEIDFLLLKTQFEALRTWTIVKVCQDLKPQEVWKSKYLLWQLERENLQALQATTPSSLDSSRVCQRLYELQILLDVAHIRGNLEEYETVRYIDATTREKAKLVAPDDFDEGTILRKLASLL